MLDIPQAVRELAEDVLAYAPLRDGDRRTVTAGYVVNLAITPGPHSTVVSRLRLAPGEVAATVSAIRAMLRAAGRTIATWEVGNSATPTSLDAELVALGMRPEEPPFTVTHGMVLPGVAPRSAAPAPDLRVTQVTTQQDFRRAQEIYWRCFKFIPDEATQAGLEADYRRLMEGQIGRRYLAWKGERAIAAADAVLTDVGVLLFGGATLPEERGQGAYQALVQERWRLALQHGTPFLITQAGAWSRPILSRLGFVETAEIHNFVDHLA